MLNEEEISTLNHYLAISKGLHPAQFHYDMTTPAFQWLALKLQECNDELIQLKESLKKYSKEEDISKGVTFKPNNPIKHCGREDCSVCDKAIRERNS